MEGVGKSLNWESEESSCKRGESRQERANFSARMRDSDVEEGLLKSDFNSISSLSIDNIIDIVV